MKKIAFICRQNTGWMDGYYMFPSGKVEPDETYSACAIREAKEEVGVIVSSQDAKQVLTMHRQEHGENNWVDSYFVVEKWQGEPYNAEPKKSSEFVWLDPKNLPPNIVPGVRYALEQIAAGNRYCEYNWS